MRSQTAVFWLAVLLVFCGMSAFWVGWRTSPGRC